MAECQRITDRRFFLCNRNRPRSAVLEQFQRRVERDTPGLEAARNWLVFAGQIEQAFVYGSVARQQDTAHSDVDLMVVSPSLGYGELFGALEAATQTLGRTINPTLYTPQDIAKRIEQDNAFVTRVLQQPTVWLIGKQEQLHVPTTG